MRHAISRKRARAKEVGMKQGTPPDIPLAAVIFAATAVALRAAGRRPAVTTDLPDLAGHGMVTPPGTPGGGPDNSVEQMQHVFH